jgi:hypothetical protein
MDADSPVQRSLASFLRVAHAAIQFSSSHAQHAMRWLINALRKRALPSRSRTASGKPGESSMQSNKGMVLMI